MTVPGSIIAVGWTAILGDLQRLVFRNAREIDLVVMRSDALPARAFQGGVCSANHFDRRERVARRYHEFAAPLQCVAEVFDLRAKGLHLVVPVAECLPFALVAPAVFRLRPPHDDGAFTA